ncbi:MAG: N,N-dimethylformamidase beta subunit family domain-containing protein [Planctomycetia bacterium]
MTFCSSLAPPAAARAALLAAAILPGTAPVAAATFRFGDLPTSVPDGFVVERVAGPPLVERPVTLALDEEGRLYVAESSGSNAKLEEQRANPQHRIYRLEDTDGDGVADEREVWHDGKTLTNCGNDLHGPSVGPDGMTIHVSTRPARPFTIDLYRMGWYGGDGGRRVASLGEFAGGVQADPPVGAKRLRRCDWPATTAVTIPADWPSGVYVGKLACRGDGAAPGPQSYVIFIVRDERPADLIFQCSDFTWQAYNRWPDQFALYDDGDQKWYWGGGVQVGFDRPYAKYYQILDQPLSVGSGGDPAPIPGLEIVATGPTQSAPGKPNGGTYTATVYPGPRGNIAFNASTCWWADGLSAPPGYVRPSVYTSPQGPDERLQRITANVLARMLAAR